MKSFSLNTPGYKLTGMIFDIAKYRLFRPFRTGTTEITNRNFRTKAELWARVDRRTLVQAPPPPPPSNFIAGRPKAALLFWFFGDFRCGVPLFIVILVKYK